MLSASLTTLKKLATMKKANFGENLYGLKEKFTSLSGSTTPLVVSDQYELYSIRGIGGCFS